MSTSSNQQSDTPPTVATTSTSEGNRNNNGNSNSSKKSEKKTNDNKKLNFKGATESFQDKVFATKAEMPSCSFRETLDMARTFVAVTYPETSKRFTSLFDNKPRNPRVKMPDELTGDERADQVLVSMYIDDRKRAMALKEKVTNHLFSFFEVLLGQCTVGVKSKLAGHPDFEAWRLNGDCAGLLGAIRQIMFDFAATKYPVSTMHEAELDLFRTKQSTTNLPEYISRFGDAAEAAEHCGKSFGKDEGIRRFVATNPKFADLARIRPGEAPPCPEFLSVEDIDDLVALDQAAANVDDNDDPQHVLQALRIMSRELESYHLALDDYEERKDQYERRLDKTCSDLHLAMLFVTQADKKRFGSYQDKLSDSFLEGTFLYPTSVEDAAQILSERTVDSGAVGKSGGGNNNPGKGKGGGKGPNAGNNNQYAQISSDAVKPAKVRANRPEEEDLIEEEVDGDYGATEMAYANLPPTPSTKLCVDSGSTIDSCNNKALLTNIVDCEPKRVQGIAGSQVYSKMGTFGGLFKMYYDPNTPENLVSLGTLQSVGRVTFDSARDSAIVVTFPDGHEWRFNKAVDGLHYFDTTLDAKLSNTLLNAYCYITTVVDNEKKFHRREVLAAQKAGEYYRKLCWPSQSTYEDIVRNNKVTNCPVTVADVKRFFLIYGPDACTLQGKAVKRNGSVPPPVLSDLPDDVLRLHRDVTLCVDIFYLQGIIFLTTISEKIKFRTAVRLDDRHLDTIFNELLKIIALYEARGFSITKIRGDNEFRPLTNRLLPVRFEGCAADDHISDVERSIRTIKSDVRTLAHALPFTRFPVIFLIEMVYHAVRSRNQLPTTDGISSTLSPSTIVTGAPQVDFNLLTLEFGSYVQVFNERRVTNSLLPRTTGAIAMNPTSDNRGSYYFLNLDTGMRIIRRQWKLLPMPRSAIDQFEHLALTSGLPRIRTNVLLFERRPGVPIPDTMRQEELESVTDPDFVDLHPQSDLAALPTANVRPSEVADLIADAADFTPTHATRRVVLPQGAPPAPVAADDNVVVQPDDNDSDVDTDSDDDSDDEPLPALEYDDDSDDDSDDDDDYPDEPDTNNSADDNDDDSHEDEPPAEAENRHDGADIEGDQDCSGERGANDGERGANDGERGANSRERGANTEGGASAERETVERERSHPRYNLRSKTSTPKFNKEFDNPNNSKSYTAPPSLQFLQSSVREMANDPQKLHDALCDVYERFVDVCFNQMSAKEGIKKHGEKAIMALFSEFAQLHDKKVMRAIRAADLTHQQRCAALHAINVIKEKRDGRVKGRTCADGRKQRGLYTKDETASPTVSNDSLFATLVLAAAEGRKMMTWDVEGAYLLADQDDFVLLKFVGTSVDILCQVDPKYKDFISFEKGKKVLYLQLLKALYGTLKAALLWYELYVTKLKGLGFTLNPYDRCVANKVINGKQCTVAWHVDDNVATHVDQRVLEKLSDDIRKHVGAITCSSGDSHEFLGMDISMNGDGTVTIGMKRFIQECIDEFPEPVKKGCTTPARSNLFTVDPKSPSLVGPKADKFRSLVMKVMYVAQRCRTDLLTTLAFLCTRVDKATNQDWEKLRRLITYMNGSKNDTLTLGVESSKDLLSFTDASFAVHEDMKSHTGSGTSFGRGFFMTRSTKQKMNSGSSTEAEIIGAAEYIPSTIWLMKFLKAQGHDLQYSSFYQDNESAIKLERHGKQSSSRRSRHFDIKLFNVKDKVEQHGIDIVYCPTDLMVADFFTKPLQGNLFRKMKSYILGERPLSELKLPPRAITGPKERVGHHDQRLADNDGLVVPECTRHDKKTFLEAAKTSLS